MKHADKESLECNASAMNKPVLLSLLYHQIDHVFLSDPGITKISALCRFNQHGKNIIKIQLKVLQRFHNKVSLLLYLSLCYTIYKGLRCMRMLCRYFVYLIGS